MVLKCRPFYLPREFTAILVVAVYLPPNPAKRIERRHSENCTEPSVSSRQHTQTAYSS